MRRMQINPAQEASAMIESRAVIQVRDAETFRHLHMSRTAHELVPRQPKD